MLNNTAHIKYIFENIPNLYWLLIICNLTTSNTTNEVNATVCAFAAVSKLSLNKNKTVIASKTPIIAIFHPRFF